MSSIISMLRNDVKGKCIFMFPHKKTNDVKVQYFLWIVSGEQNSKGLSEGNFVFSWHKNACEGNQQVTVRFSPYKGPVMDEVFLCHGIVQRFND